MFFTVAALFVLCQAVQGGVLSAPAAVVPAPVPAARIVAAPAAAPFIAAAATPFVGPVAAPFVASAAAPFVAAPAPFAAYTKAVPQNVAPFASSLNYVARAPLLPYTVGGHVASPYVETFSAPLVAKKFAPVAAAPVAAPLVAAPGPVVF